MNLPKINVRPIHEIELKVLDKKVKISPYTIKEEKVILTATSSNNSNEIMNSYFEVLKNCVLEEIDFQNLSMVDFLTLVINIKAKSTSEEISLTNKCCENCKTAYEFSVDICECLEYENTENRKDVLKINDDLSFEIIPLSVKFLSDINEQDKEYDFYLKTAAYSISKVIFKNKIYKDLDVNELIDNVLSNLSTNNILDIFKKVNNLISLKLNLSSICTKCGHKHESEVRDFLNLLN